MWIIKVDEFNKEKAIHHGNQFLIGSLKLGVRGTLDEYTKSELVAINLPFIYDQVGDLWREPVNAFNPLFTTIKVNDKIVDVKHMQPTLHEQSLDIKTATMHRKTTFKLDDNEVTISSSRFVYGFEERLIIGKYSVQLKKPAKLSILTGIDLEIWDINGSHIKDIKTSIIDDVLVATGKTHETQRKIETIKVIKYNQAHITFQSEVIDNKLLNVLMIDQLSDEVFTFEQFAHIGVDEITDDNISKLNQLKMIGYDALHQSHCNDWQLKWYDADVELSGDDEAALALRYSIYHLLLLAPNGVENASIPARGISGQTYKGAIFWDTEIFMLPFYLNTDVVSAKQIIQYRINTLKGAMDKAKSYGFKGAFFAWESQEDGFDACSDYNVTDVFTGRKVRTYFKDKQVHISADIVYALKMYVNRTKDDDILKQGGLKLVLEVARFYLDYGNYKALTDQFEIWDVMGPDEYHERVHNNVFTNQMVQMVFKYVLELEHYYKDQKSVYFNDLINDLNFERSLKLIHKYVEKIKMNQPNQFGVIEQFDGYFKLRDMHKHELLSQRLHPNEYLGGQGLAGDTQIIKQADVIAMLYLFKEQYSLEILKDNFNYYEPRTEHGSSLSASMYALIACMMDNPDYAWPLFLKSATVDLTGDSKQYAGGIYIGGTHPAAAGGAYLTIIEGFAGLAFKNGKISINPSLPKHIESLRFKVKHINKQYEVFVSKDKQTIKELTNI